jgi:hypothetical protein
MDDMEKPQPGQIWEVTVNEPRATRVNGTYSCAVEFVPSWGSVMFVQWETGDPHLEFNDSLIESTRRVL